MNLPVTLSHGHICCERFPTSTKIALILGTPVHSVPLSCTSMCVLVVVCGTRKLRLYLSYGRRGDRINLGLLRSLDSGGGVRSGPELSSLDPAMPPSVRSCLPAYTHAPAAPPTTPNTLSAVAKPVQYCPGDHVGHLWLTGSDLAGHDGPLRHARCACETHPLASDFVVDLTFPWDRCKGWRLQKPPRRRLLAAGKRFQ